MRDYLCSPKRPDTQLRRTPMKTVTKYAAPWLALAAIGGAIALAPIASADTDPLVPYGTNPTRPTSSVSTSPTTTRPTPRTARWTFRSDPPPTQIPGCSTSIHLTKEDENETAPHHNPGHRRRRGDGRTCSDRIGRRQRAAEPG